MGSSISARDARGGKLRARQRGGRERHGRTSACALGFNDRGVYDACVKRRVVECDTKHILWVTQSPAGRRAAERGKARIQCLRAGRFGWLNKVRYG